MKEFDHHGHNDAGQRLDRFLAKAVPPAAGAAGAEVRPPRSASSETAASAPRAIRRLERGRPCSSSISTTSFLKPRRADNAYLTVTAPKLQHRTMRTKTSCSWTKRPGLAVHPHDGAEYGKTLIDHIQAYLYAKREWNRPREEHSFAPAALQPHRPQYRRHRDRRQERGGAAHPQPEDQGP